MRVFSSVPFLLCSLSSLPLSLSFSLPLSLSFHSILTKYRYIECKVQIRLEKSVFSSFFRFVKFEIFQIQNLSYLFFSFYILFQLPGCQEFYYLYFNIYILMINFIFKKIDKNCNHSQFRCFFFSLFLWR